MNKAPTYNQIDLIKVENTDLRRQLEDTCRKLGEEVGEHMLCAQERNDLRRQLEDMNAELTKDDRELNECKDASDDEPVAECGHLERFRETEVDQSAWCAMCALESAERERQRLQAEVTTWQNEVLQIRNELERWRRLAG